MPHSTSYDDKLISLGEDVEKVYFYISLGLAGDGDDLLVGKFSYGRKVSTLVRFRELQREPFWMNLTTQEAENEMRIYDKERERLRNQDNKGFKRVKRLFGSTFAI